MHPHDAVHSSRTQSGASVMQRPRSPIRDQSPNRSAMTSPYRHGRRGNRTKGTERNSPPPNRGSSHRQNPRQHHTVLTDNSMAFADLPKNPPGPTRRLLGPHIFDRVCLEHRIDHWPTKPYQPWTNGQAERMNRTVKHATVTVFIWYYCCDFGSRPRQIPPGATRAVPIEQLVAWSVTAHRSDPAS